MAERLEREFRMWQESWKTPKDLGDSVQERGKEHAWLYHISWQTGARITSCFPLVT